ncbi:hypothetical protein SOM26_16665 [Sphingomonas sp. CFBP8993]|uniref:hypothetical protein n=1 Tax=Sphingomonas sp. CFBP8993 TaxID=3096526 RepID=UPI002A6992FD|nr:hypothetical protein [Sphingomonas sp. CFBP8993]MDY0960326.1 hypothetical protein [Sphingomonas sp. CFBP8993]
MVKANGATLYDKTIFLFGFAENITRSLDLEKQTAISIVWQNEVFASSYPKRWSDGWTHIGALTGYSTSLSLQAHLDGPCEVVWDNGLSVGFASFDSMLTTLVALVAPCFTCTGIRDQTYKELESTLDQLRSMR